MYFTKDNTSTEWLNLLIERGACQEGLDYVTAMGEIPFEKLILNIAEDKSFPYDWAAWVADKMADTLDDEALLVFFKKGFRSGDSRFQLEGVKTALEIRDWDVRIKQLDVVVDDNFIEAFESKPRGI